MAEKNLKRSEKFFALVYHLRWAQKRYTALHKEVAAIEKTVPEENSNLEQLRQERDRMLSNALATEKLVDAEIKFADDYYEKNGLEKFW